MMVAGSVPWLNSLCFVSLFFLALDLRAKQKEHFWETWTCPRQRDTLGVLVTYRYSLLAREAGLKPGQPGTLCQETSLPEGRERENNPLT